MKKIVITGGSGLVGNAIRVISKEHSYEAYEIIFLSSKDCDLTNFEKTDQLFRELEPNYIIHLAANVGGLFKNLRGKVEMFESNMLININVLRCAYLNKVEKVISCLSTCIFPDDISYPIDETMLHLGPPHNSNDAYAYSKRMVEVLSRSYNEQYGTNFVCIIPTNIYGPYDNFSLEDGHVIPALIHQCYLAKKNNKPFMIKGTGKPLRQFIYSEDLARLILWVLEEYKERDSIILSPDEGDEISIGSIAKIIADVFDHRDMKFNEEYSDGQFKKTASNLKLRGYLPDFRFKEIEEGIRKTVEWFSKNFDNVRK